MTSLLSPVRFRRRGIQALAAVAAGSLVLAGCGGAAVSGDNSSDEPIKIGVLLPYTGPFGLYGKPMEAALTARLKLDKNLVGDRKVELVFEDEATDPATAVSKANKLVDQDGVSAVVCCATGAATLAVGPILAERGIPQLGPIPNPDGLSEFETAAVAAPTAGHDAGKVGEHAAGELGYKTAVIVASDFAYGHEVAENFKKSFTEGGGAVVKEVFAPLGSNDFASYLSQLPNADVVFAGFAGADAVRFVQQYNKFGMKAKMPLIGHGPLITELVLNQIGPSAVGVGAGFYYSSTLDNAENELFISTMKGINPDFVPSHFTAGAWASGSVLLDAIDRAAEDADDGKKLAKAVRATKIDAPWGSLEFDAETGYAISPTYFYTVVPAGPGLAHKIDAEIP
jgi:branched-chain amino acid transport system substrate-binding protein